MFDYVSVVYDCLSAKDSRTLQKIQNCALRIILRKDRRAYIADMHIETRLNYLSDRRHLHILVQTYKGVNGIAPNRVCEHINLIANVQTICTRAGTTNKLVVPNYRLNVCQKSFRYRGPIVWNLVDNDIITARNVNCFKAVLQRSDMFEVILIAS